MVAVVIIIGCDYVVVGRIQSFEVQKFKKEPARYRTVTLFGNASVTHSAAASPPLALMQLSKSSHTL